MSDDLNKQVEALPPIPKSFIEGYMEQVDTGYVPKGRSYLSGPADGYELHLTAATDVVCMRCGAIVAFTELHDAFHDKVENE